MDSTEAKAWGTWCLSGQQATATDMLVHSEATTILGETGNSYDSIVPAGKYMRFLFFSCE